MRVHFERSAKYNESKGHFGGYDDQPFEFQLEIVKIENIKVEFDVLRVLSGLDSVSISGISRDELVALRDTINAHLGETVTLREVTNANS
mgnify:CR=1 FL=1